MFMGHHRQIDLFGISIIFLASFAFTSCTNSEPSDESKSTRLESEAATPPNNTVKDSVPFVTPTPPNEPETEYQNPVQECPWESATVTLEDAIEGNPYVAPAVEKLLGDRGERTEELILVGPTALWYEHDLEPPLDRSTSAILAIRSTGEATVFYINPEDKVHYDFCDDHIVIALEVTLTLPELDVSLTTNGEASVSESGQMLGPDMEFETLGRCHFSGYIPEEPDGSPFDNLRCDGLLFSYGSKKCLDTEQWLIPETDPVSGLELNEALQHVVEFFPTDFHCSNSATSLPVGTVTKITIPERYCGDGAWIESRVPVSVELTGADGTVAVVTAVAEWRLNEKCYLQECTDYMPCGMTYSTEAATWPVCSRAWMAVDVSAFFFLTVQVEEDGSLLVGAEYAQSGLFPNSTDGVQCWGQRMVD